MGGLSDEKVQDFQTTIDPGVQSVGKVVGGSRYVHVLALESISSRWQVLLSEARRHLDAPTERFNVVRLDERTGTVAFLSYPEFWDSATPALSESVLVDPESGVRSRRFYSDSINPPVLHRKELLLPTDHPKRASFEALTSALENLGLFQNPHLIGFARSWETMVQRSGYVLEGNELLPIGNAAPTDDPLRDTAVATAPGSVLRHRTALVRTNFSAPVQLLHRFGFFDRGWSFFDYGCGRGGDLRGLQELGIQAAGWDPFFRPEAPREPSEIVNLGFVLNVIEDSIERLDTLKQAFELAGKLLSVAVMPASNQSSMHAAYSDGVLTSRQTFQRYFTQTELSEMVEHTLERRPTLVAPGICLVFRSDDDQEEFERARIRGRLRLLGPAPRLSRRPATAEIERQPPRLRSARSTSESLTEEQLAMISGYWELTLEKGRWPLPTEVPATISLEIVGSVRRVQQLCLARFGDAPKAQAAAQRREDVLVYLAMEASQGRTLRRGHPESFRADLAAHFQGTSEALSQASDLLGRLRETEALQSAARDASERGLGYLDSEYALHVCSAFVPRLAAVLRLYVALGARLYGDVANADLVKIHTRSGKLSFMRFNDFEGKPLPRLLERTKVNLRRQVVEVFEYEPPFEPPYLYMKSRFLNEESPNYSEQLAFDEALQTLPFLDLSGHGPSATALDATLEAHHYKVDGFELKRVGRPPTSLDAFCGRHFSYRQLVECGETQRATGLSNMPKSSESFVALFDLATQILDPVIEYFGSIELTYGFCSAELARKVPGRNAPSLDQHSAHECNRTGKLICERRGAAVDFLVRDENMREVADWIIDNLPFDRLYFYGDDRPLHVSFGPEQSRQAIVMKAGKSGRLVPAPYVRVSDRA
jgi:DNA phosphorothioation-associated putative methyltransferase